MATDWCSNFARDNFVSPENILVVENLNQTDLGLDDALGELKQAVSPAPNNTMLLAQLGQAHARVGKLGEARAVLQELQELSGKRMSGPTTWRMSTRA